ncbi:MAG: FkbM family methyltransferase [Fimbriimonadales bacterium]
MRIAAVAGPKFLLGKYEQEFFKAFKQSIKRGMVVYDVGAHWGFYSLIAARLTGVSGQVIAFEPLPNNIQILRKNLIANKIRNVSLIEAAVAEQDGLARFDPGDDTGLGHLSSEGSLEVRVVSLDSLWEKKEIPPPAVIKIDVEGAEELVLKGAQQLLTRFHPTLLIEIHGKDQFHRCYELLTSMDYVLTKLQDDKRVMYHVEQNLRR